VEATARQDTRQRLAAIADFDWQAAWTWLLGFGLTVYLGLKGGGYDPLVTDQIGIVVWWVVLAGLLVGAFPRRNLGRIGWSSLGLLAAFAAWAALSLTWTESTGNTGAELANICTYLGVFALALFTRGSRGARRMVAAVATAIGVIAIVALLSRLHPAWFPNAAQTSHFLKSTRDRLGYPLNYWNGLAALIAVGLPLMLHLATSVRSVLLRSLAAASLPAMMLTIALTLSRGGIAAAAIAVAVYLAVASDRLERLTMLLLAGLGGAILVVGASQRTQLHEGLLTEAARHQGNELLTMTLVVCVGVGLLAAALAMVLTNDLRPAWTRPSRRAALICWAVVVVAALTGATAINAPHRISHAWTQFKQGGFAQGGNSRLTSAAGGYRYQMWKTAMHETESQPLHGTGAGTYEFWWAKSGHRGGSVKDAHSLYFQTLGELGVVGLLLLVGFFAIVIGVGVWLIRSASGNRGRPQLAALLAGVVAFLVAAAFDWVWQLPVIPVAALLLAGALISAGMRSRSNRRPNLRLVARAGLLVAAAAALVAITVPFTSARLLRESQSDALADNFPAAIEAARTAQNVQPSAAMPRLQQALLLEQQGQLDAAAKAARAAATREPSNWRNWLILARIEAERGNAKPAVQALKEAKALNPRSPVFD